MDKEKKSLLAEFTQKAMQRLEAKKRPKYQTLYIPSLEDNIKIRSLTRNELIECSAMADEEEAGSNRADCYTVYLGVVEPSLKEVANSIMAQEAGLSAEERQLHEAMDIVNMFELYEIGEIALAIMRLSGVIGSAKVFVVDELKN